MTILVTASTGNVGREVVHALQAKGIAFRAADSRPERVVALLGDDVPAVRLDFRETSTFLPAIEGCTAVFLLRPPAIANVKETLLPFIDAARAQGARQIVFLSVAGAGKNKLVPHHAVEAHLARRSDDWTILRPGFFAQNLGDAYRLDIVDDDRLYVPAGRGRVAFVDVRDVAEVAAAALADPSAHVKKAYTLTGPAAVTFDDAAALLSEALGRPIRYEPASVVGYARHLRSRGMPATQIMVQTILHLGLRFGQGAHVDPTLASLLGRPGRTLREYIRDHVDVWKHRDGAKARAG